MGIPEKVTEKATLITFVLDINNLKRGKVEKWVANSLMTDLGDGNWEIPAWLGGKILYELITIANWRPWMNRVSNNRYAPWMK